VKSVSVRQKIVLCWGVFSLVLSPPVAYAEAPPTPGAVLGTLPPTRPVLPTSPAQILLPESSELPVFDRNGKRFQVHSFHFVGATAYSRLRLKRVVERFVDLELNLYELNLAADAVTEFYRDHGYTLAHAIIPAQRVENGVVTIAVIEGRVGRVLFSGNKSYSDDFLQARTSHLKSGKLVTSRDLERTLLLMNDLPGLTVRGTLAPGDKFGTSDILIKADEHRLAGSVSMDNSGRSETGSVHKTVTGEINNPLGIGDQLTLNAVITNKRLTKSAGAGYSLPLGDDGWRLSANYSRVRYDVSGTFAALGLSGSVRTGTLGLSYPLVRSRGHNEILGIDLRRTRLTQQTLGITTSVVTLPVADFTYTSNSIDDDASVNTLMAKASTNGRQQNATGTRQDAELLRVEVDDNYLMPLNRYWSLYVRGALAYSHDRLPDSDKYSIGGPGSVRAYRAAELRGDSGYQGTLEFRRSHYFGKMPGVMSLFYDIGHAIYKQPGHSDTSDTISGYGVGFTLYPARQALLKLELARTGRNSYHAADGHKSRVWLSLNIKL
jgi:hemolysin activation/secretion protein